MKLCQISLLCCLLVQQSTVVRVRKLQKAVNATIGKSLRRSNKGRSATRVKEHGRNPARAVSAPSLAREDSHCRISEELRFARAIPGHGGSEPTEEQCREARTFLSGAFKSECGSPEAKLAVDALFEGEREKLGPLIETAKEKAGNRRPLFWCGFLANENHSAVAAGSPGTAMWVNLDYMATSLGAFTDGIMFGTGVRNAWDLMYQACKHFGKEHELRRWRHTFESTWTYLFTEVASSKIQTKTGFAQILFANNRDGSILQGAFFVVQELGAMITNLRTAKPDTNVVIQATLRVQLDVHNAPTPQVREYFGVPKEEINSFFDGSCPEVPFLVRVQGKVVRIQAAKHGFMDEIGTSHYFFHEYDSTGQKWNGGMPITLFCNIHVGVSYLVPGSSADHAEVKQILQTTNGEITIDDPQYFQAKVQLKAL